MKRDDVTTMTIVIPNLKATHTIALEAVLREMEMLGSIGSSRFVALYSDGDGNFRPVPQISYTIDPYGTKDDDARTNIRRSAFIGRDEDVNLFGDNRFFDTDPVYRALWPEEYK